MLRTGDKTVCSQYVGVGVAVLVAVEAVRPTVQVSDITVHTHRQPGLHMENIESNGSRDYNLLAPGGETVHIFECVGRGRVGAGGGRGQADRLQQQIAILKGNSQSSSSKVSRFCFPDSKCLPQK